MKARLLAAGLLLAFSATALAAAPIKVTQAWIRWLPANLPAAGYATITNDGGHAVRLTSASSPGFGQVALMRSRLDQDDSTMVTVPYIEVPAHGSASLAPGGYHLMFGQAAHPIKPGDKVEVTLHFADGTTLQRDFSVLPANATGPSTPG